MLIVQVKEGENIDRALKRYKKKYDKTKVVRKLRSKKEYIKPSVANRKIRLKAAYIENKFRED